MGLGLAEIDVDAVSNMLTFIEENKVEISSVADRLLTCIYENKNFVKTKDYPPGYLSYQIVRCHLEKDFLRENMFMVVFHLEGNAVHELGDHYGHRYLVFRLYGTRGELIGAEWSY